eukprot:tig00000692_g3231.t1
MEAAAGGAPPAAAPHGAFQLHADAPVFIPAPKQTTPQKPISAPQARVQHLLASACERTMSETAVRQCLSDLIDSLALDERLFAVLPTASILTVLDWMISWRSLDENSKQLLANMKRTASRYRGSSGRQSAKAMDDALKMKFLKELLLVASQASATVDGLARLQPPAPPPPGGFPGAFIAAGVPPGGYGGGILQSPPIFPGAPAVVFPPQPLPGMQPGDGEVQHGGRGGQRRGDGAGRRGGNAGRGGRGRGAGDAPAAAQAGLLETPTFLPMIPVPVAAPDPASAFDGAIAIAAAAASGSGTGPPPAPRGLPAGMPQEVRGAGRCGAGGAGRGLTGRGAAGGAAAGELAALLAAEGPGPEAPAHFHRIARAVGEMVQGLAGSAGVRVVGSAGSGLHWRGSDLNLLVEAHEGAPDAATKDEFLHQLAGALMTRPAIAHAVAVKPAQMGRRAHLTFRDPESGIGVEVSVCGPAAASAALLSTTLLAAYARADARVRGLATAVKLLAQRRNLGGDLSHYAWTLMAVNFLQSVSPPVVPNLQGASAIAAIPTAPVGPAPAFNPDPASVPGFEAGANTESLCSLFLQFLAYYGYMYSPETDAVAVRIGGPARKIQTRCSSWSLWRACVEEPFAESDVARTLTKAGQARVFTELRSVWGTLCRGGALAAALPPPPPPKEAPGSPQISSRSLRAAATAPQGPPRGERQQRAPADGGGARQQAAKAEGAAGSKGARNKRKPKPAGAVAESDPAPGGAPGAPQAAAAAAAN